MKVMHLGTQILDFIPKGKPESERVQGCKIFFCYEPTSDRWYGLEVDSIFIRSSDPLYKKVLEFKARQEYCPVYEFNGRYPRLVDIQLVQSGSSAVK